MNDYLKGYLDPDEKLQEMILHFFMQVDKYLLTHPRNAEMKLFKYFKLCLEAEFKFIQQDRKDGKWDSVTRYDEYISSKKQEYGIKD